MNDKYMSLKGISPDKSSNIAHYTSQTQIYQPKYCNLKSVHYNSQSQILYMKLKIIVSNNEFETRVQQRPIGQPKQ